MNFKLFWIDFWLDDRLMGFGFFTVEVTVEDGFESQRSLFEIYYSDGEIFIDFFWFHIYVAVPFWFWWFHKEEITNVDR